MKRGTIFFAILTFSSIKEPFKLIVTLYNEKLGE